MNPTTRCLHAQVAVSRLRSSVRAGMAAAASREMATTDRESHNKYQTDMFNSPEKLQVFTAPQPAAVVEVGRASKCRHVQTSRIARMCHQVSRADNLWCMHAHAHAAPAGGCGRGA